MLTARVLPMQVLRLFSQGMRCVHRMRLMMARNTCTADVCMHTVSSQSRGLWQNGHTYMIPLSMRSAIAALKTG